MVLIGCQTAIGAVLRLWFSNIDNYVLKKCLSKGRMLTLPPHSAFAILVALLIVIMLDCCNFCEPHHQWLCDSRGNTRFSSFPSTNYKDISLHLHTNRLTGFQSHCQSLNLCLSVAECLSECEWASAPSKPPTCVCVECVYSYLVLQWINMFTWQPIIGGAVPWWQMEHQCGHFN